MKLNTIVTHTLLPAQEHAVAAIQRKAFADVSQDELLDDLFCPVDAHVLALADDEVAGYASIHHADVEFQGKQIRVGGFGGVCTQPAMQGMGIATSVCEKAMEFLRQRGDDIAFLSIDPAKGTDRLYRRVGFVLLPRKFSWTNAHDQLQADVGGMIAPVNSEALFEYVLNGTDVFYIGRGYW